MRNNSSLKRSNNVNYRGEQWSERIPMPIEDSQLAPLAVCRPCSFLLVLLLHGLLWCEMISPESHLPAVQKLEPLHP
eukprot:scaffold25626_cov137-Cylindrotheca_fusiformis.AAC.1